MAGTRTVIAMSLRQYVMILGVLAVVTVGLNVAFVWEAGHTAMDSNEAGTAHTRQTNSPAVQEPGETSGPVHIRNRFLALLALTVVSFAFCMYVGIAHIVRPVESMLRSARAVRGGNLAVAFEPRTSNELAELGETMNEMVVNYQEVLLFTGTKAGSLRQSVESIERLLAAEGRLGTLDQLETHITSARSDAEMLAGMVGEFAFYQTYFDGSKVVRDPGDCPSE